MTKVIIKAILGSTNGHLIIKEHGLWLKCALGKNGLVKNKLEGDGKTPIGKFALRKILYREDRITLPKAKLATQKISKNHIWCDDVNHAYYNQLLIRDKALRDFSHEELYRDDHKYDIIIPLGYNDDPVIVNKGSAIFFHLASPDYAPTQGCVAISKSDMLRLIPLLDKNSTMEISSMKNKL